MGTAVVQEGGSRKGPNFKSQTSQTTAIYVDVILQCHCQIAVTSLLSQGPRVCRVCEECSGHGKPYSLSGCSPMTCTEPSDAAKASWWMMGKRFRDTQVNFCITSAKGLLKYASDSHSFTSTGSSHQAAYNLTIYSLQMPRFSVSASCRFAGEAKVLPCAENGGEFRPLGFMSQAPVSPKVAGLLHGILRLTEGTGGGWLCSAAWLNRLSEVWGHRKGHAID